MLNVQIGPSAGRNCASVAIVKLRANSEVRGSLRLQHLIARDGKADGQMYSLAEDN